MEKMWYVHIYWQMSGASKTLSGVYQFEICNISESVLALSIYR